MKEAITDCLFNIMGVPFGIHRERKGDLTVETINKRAGWNPSRSMVEAKKTDPIEHLKETVTQFIFTRPAH